MEMRKLIGLSLLTVALLVQSASYAADTPKPSEKQISELLLAVKTGDIERTRVLLERNPLLVNAENSHGITPLMVAIYEHEEIVKLLVSSGANVNAEDGPLGQAAYVGDIGIMECLISNGAEINRKNYWGQTPIFSAAEGGRLEAAKLLIARGATVNAQGDFGATPLLVAVSNGCASVAKLLIDNGADVNLANSHGERPVHKATSAYMATLLIWRGANVNAADENGLTPLHMAAFYGRLPAVTVLLQKGANPTARTTGTASLQREKRYADVILPAGMTPLEFAEKAGQTEAAKLLAKAAAGDLET